ncbi:MAG: PEP-CTERM sorting domain-containing protein [Isosphaeraceae bacterium]
MRRYATSLLLALALASGSTSAAASLPYVVTDLGVGEATLAPDRGLVLAPDGTIGYAFMHQDHRVTNLDALRPSLPPLTNAPVSSPMTYGNPANAYSEWANTGMFLNSHGVLVATNLTGVLGHTAGAGSQVLALDRTSDGTFEIGQTLFRSSENRETGGQIAQALDLNDAGQVLGVTQGSGPYGRDFLVYNLAAGSSSVVSRQLAGWVLQSAQAIDEEGRILLTAFPAQGGSAHSLLLSPESAVPSPVPVPEPTAFAVVFLGFLAARRAISKRGR